MRDRLIELLNYVGDNIMQFPTDGFIAALADHLLANGVIVPPCKVGHTAFLCDKVCDEEGKEKFAISEGEIVSFSLQKEGLWAYCRYKNGLTYWHIVAKDFGKTVFLTREEAEKALAERSEG